MPPLTQEAIRLQQAQERTAHWRRWGRTSPNASGVRYAKTTVPLHEYFHGDNGAGLGASHQTGWTALVAKLLQQSGT